MGGINLELLWRGSALEETGWKQPTVNRRTSATASVPEGCDSMQNANGQIYREIQFARCAYLFLYPPSAGKGCILKIGFRRDVVVFVLRGTKQE